MRRWNAEARRLLPESRGNQRDGELGECANDEREPLIPTPAYALTAFALIDVAHRCRLA
jgi:hypothetical protein